MVWILILTLTFQNGAAVTTAEFNTKELCVVAGERWKIKNGSSSVNAEFQCSPKGNLISSR